MAGTTQTTWPEWLSGTQAVFEQALLGGDLLTVFEPPSAAQPGRFLALLRAPRPAVGRLRRLSVLPELLLEGSSARLEDPVVAGGLARALLNARPAGDVADTIRAALPAPAWTGADTLATMGLPLRLVLDAVIHVPPGGIALAGALVDPMRLLTRLALRQGEASYTLDHNDWAVLPRHDLTLAGARPPLPDDAARHDAATGFVAYAAGPFAEGDPLCLEVETRTGAIGHMPLPRPAEAASLAIIEQFLALPRQPISRMEAAIDRTVGPIVRGLNRARLANRPVPRRMDFGLIPQAPARALIIPLHGRLDFMAMQLALFSASPDADAEIIYVLDDPRLWNEAERLAQSCLVRFALPFTVVDLGAHLGYAPANNAGLAVVRAKDVCLLNADVFPRQGEGMAWLAALCEPLRERLVGAVGATLLFEDDTLQHGGMAYRRIAGLPPWPFPVHTGKGSRPALAGNGAREVGAVTGACLAARRDDLVSLGGLDEDCVIADFEDACLCEALRARGLRIMLHQAVVLHHLERQTPGSDAPWRFGATLVNASHFSRRWMPDAQS